jgi:L-ascorbate metabolism protein UlaG (beta-lactamase superfamily)
MKKRQLSDHYDGRRFYNPTYPEVPGLWNTLGLLSSWSPAPWPGRVENHPDLRLDHQLAPHEAAVTFVNHATVLIQLPGLNVLTDPVWSERASPLSWLGPKRVRDPGIPFDALPRIDLVLVSHNHYDHLDLATLRRLDERFAPLTLVPLGDRARVESAGVRRVTALDWWEGVAVDRETRITFTPAQHFSARGLFDRNKSLWGSYAVQHGGHLIYFGGDTGYSTHFAEIRARLGPSDLAFLPIGAYEPNWFMGPMHMNPAEAVKAHRDLAARQSVAIHFGTFQLTEEAIDRPIRDLEVALARHRVAASEFIVLDEGRTRIVPLEQPARPSPVRTRTEPALIL